MIFERDGRSLSPGVVPNPATVPTPTARSLPTRGHAPSAQTAAAADPSTGDPPADDATLVRLALVDAEAFGLLYDRYCDRIYRFVLRRLSDHAAAEDVTNEAFIKAMRALDTYRPQIAPFSSWLFRIAANATTDYVRTRRPTEPLDDTLDVADPAIALDDQVAARVDGDRIWAAVDRLTDAQRVAVTLRWAHDLPIADIARRLNRSEGAVKLLLNRGMAAVRSHLAESDTRPIEPDRSSGEETPA